MKKTALVPIADGTEEIEAVCLIDTLRRADIEVTVASVNERQVKASRGVHLVADCLIHECGGRTYDLIALPGGMPGAENLGQNPTLRQLLNDQNARQKWIAAICAAPAVILLKQGLLQDKKATAHPGFSDLLPDQSAVEQHIVTDGHIITSRGPGTALELALECVKLLVGAKTAEDIAKAMVAA